MKTISVMFCKFKRRNGDDSWESGVMINEDNLIIDMDGNPVKGPVWNHIVQPSSGAMIINAKKFE